MDTRQKYASIARLWFWLFGLQLLWYGFVALRAVVNEDYFSNPAFSTAVSGGVYLAALMAPAVFLLWWLREQRYLWLSQWCVAWLLALGLKETGYLVLHEHIPALVALALMVASFAAAWHLQKKHLKEQEEVKKANLGL